MEQWKKLLEKAIAEKKFVSVVLKNRVAVYGGVEKIGEDRYRVTGEFTGKTDFFLTHVDKVIVYEEKE